MRVVLLGASGFLGTELLSQYKKKEEKEGKNDKILILKKDELIKKSNKVEQIIERFKPDKVINAIAPRLRLNPTQNEVRAACIEAPKLIFDIVRAQELKCTWIDCGTYWEVCSNELNKIEKYYVESKIKFRNYSISNENSLLRYKNVILNHIIGQSENKNRLIPDVLHKLKLGEKIYLKNPENLIPVTCINRITKILIDFKFQGVENCFYIEPDWSGTVLELVKTFKILLQSQSLIEYENQSKGAPKMNHLNYFGVKIGQSKPINFNNIVLEYE